MEKEHTCMIQYGRFPSIKSGIGLCLTVSLIAGIWEEEV